MSGALGFLGREAGDKSTGSWGGRGNEGGGVRGLVVVRRASVTASLSLVIARLVVVAVREGRGLPVSWWASDATHSRVLVAVRAADVAAAAGSGGSELLKLRKAIITSLGR